ncbi:MAG TPA: GDCCVxC domain-containing (seleno)protein [Rhodanobacteraceae bacterium]|nr:GDCCVxC domain-containing (seleno)protein [Rhodanobacteraceae bacterium]
MTVERPETGRASVLESTITCPRCGVATRASMPIDTCQFFWDCPACDAVIRPEPGDCCVFCSYGDVPCPPVQASRNHRDSASRA